jgi:hypothetical protein
MAIQMVYLHAGHVEPASVWTFVVSTDVDTVIDLCPANGNTGSVTRRDKKMAAVLGRAIYRSASKLGKSLDLGLAHGSLVEPYRSSCAILILARDTERADDIRKLFQAEVRVVNLNDPAAVKD